MSNLASKGSDCNFITLSSGKFCIACQISSDFEFSLPVISFVNSLSPIALFNKLIGEIYLAKQDFESAKVYLEKAIIISKQFDLQYIEMQTYLLSAKLYQEFALPKSNQRGNYVKQALKMFQLAKNVPIVAVHQNLQKTIKEELSILTSFCKLNGIILKKG